MKQVIAWLGKHWKFVVGCVGTFVICSWVLAQIDIYDQRAVLAGQVDLLKAQNKQVASKADKIISENVKAIAEKDKVISLLNTTIGKANDTIKKLIGDYATLDEEYKKASTCPEKLTIALRQIDNLKGQIAEKDNVISSLTSEVGVWRDKFNLQVGISASWEAKFNAEHALRLADDDLIKSLNTSLRVCKLTGGVKTVLVGACIAYFGARAVGVIK